MKNKILPLLFPIFFIFSSCAGYKMGAVKDPGFKKVFIENFKSDVNEPALENLVTTTVIKEFQNDGTIEISSEKDADVILRGHITGFDMSPVRFTRGNELTPAQVVLKIEVTFTLTKQGETKPYSGEKRATGTSSFFIGNDLQSDKRQGVPLAAERLGRQMVSLLVEGW